MKNKKHLFAIAALLLSCQALADGINVTDAWARATAPGQETGSVGLVISSRKDARIIAVRSPVAASAEIHTMSMENGVMKMRQLANLPIPANQPVTLGPGGVHLMLVGLKHALKAGESVPLTITVQIGNAKPEKIKISALIRSLTASNEADQRR